MGLGINGERPPDNAEHPPRIEVYRAAGGWQCMLISWSPYDGRHAGHYDVWETGCGPYAFEASARAEATAWAKAWGVKFAVSREPPDPQRAPPMVDSIRELFPMAQLDDDEGER